MKPSLTRQTAFAFLIVNIERLKSDVISVQLSNIACTDKKLFEYIFDTVSDSIGEFGMYEISILPNYGINVFTIRINKAALL